MSPRRSSWLFLGFAGILISGDTKGEDVGVWCCSDDGRERTW